MIATSVDSAGGDTGEEVAPAANQAALVSAASDGNATVNPDVIYSTSGTP